MRHALLGLLPVALLACANPAQAATTVFFNNFSTGLSPAESVTGEFKVANGFVGNQTPYSNNTVSTYAIAFATAGLVNPTLSFDLNIMSENGYDDLAIYDLYTDAGGATVQKLLGDFTGTLVQSLSYALLPTTTGVQFRFSSDATINGPGVKLDNVAITADTPAAAVPEPATWATMLMGVALAGLGLRQRRRRTPAVA